MVDFIKHSFVFDYLINLYIRLYILIFKINGTLKLKYQYKRRILSLRFINRNRNTNLESDPEYKQKIKEFLMSNFNGYCDISWSLCYTRLNGISDHRYIPDDIYYDYIEKRLNNFTHAYTYNDKNTYKTLFKDVNVPETLFRIMNGKLFDEDYQPLSFEDVQKRLNNQELVVFKPSIDSGGGKNVVIDKPNVIINDMVKLFNSTSNRVQLNYIAQKHLKQHPQLSKFHPQSVNTMRIMTLRIDHEVVHLSTVFRMGRGESRIDNQMSGGIACGIDKNGRLKKYAYDKVFNPFEKHPDTNLSFEGQEIPLYLDAVLVAKKLHEKLLYFDIVSWDLTIGVDNRVYLIEINLCWQGVNLHQISNGPLFGEHTENILAYINNASLT